MSSVFKPRRRRVTKVSEGGKVVTSLYLSNILVDKISKIAEAQKRSWNQVAVFALELYKP